MSDDINSPKRVKSPKLFAMPRGHDARLSITLALICSVFFLVVFGGASLLSEIIPWRFQVSFQFENSLPFTPWASIVYLSMTLLLGLSLFILRKPEEIIPLFCVLIVEIIIGGLFFVLLPMDTSFPAREAQGFSGWLFDIANFVNMKRNYFPSLHVCFAFTAAFFYSNKTNKAGALFFYVWALAISISTLLIHEHYLIDVIAGIVLAFVCWKVVGRWAVREDIMNAFQNRLKSFLF